MHLPDGRTQVPSNFGPNASTLSMHATRQPSPTALNAGNLVQHQNNHSIHERTNMANQHAKQPLPPMQLSSTNKPKVKPRYQCSVDKCTTSCSRSSDLPRHYQEKHNAGNVWYQCPKCGEWSFRIDKIREHCRVKEKQAPGQERFSVIEKGRQHGSQGESIVDAKPKRTRSKRPSP